jgi:GT2 family glycosyltransferase
VRRLVSVVIPCRNEVKSIRATVEALLKSEDVDVEVLVVDGMSEDGTREVIDALASQDPRVRRVDNPKRLTPYAFNLGVQNAQGEFVQIVGSRNVLAPDYISLLLRALDAHPDVACVGGDYQHVGDSPSGRYISLAMESKFGVGLGNYRTMQQDALVDTVGVPLYRREIFAKVGLFDENLTRNQDDDFNFRVREHGLKILYVHAAKTTYLVRGSLRKAFRQYSQYGYFKVFVNRKHQAVTTLRQLVPPAFVLFWVVGLPLAVVALPVAVLLASVGALYVAMGLALSGKNLGLLERFNVLKACAVLHVGYGVGYLQGIWDFLIIQRAPRASFQQQTT